MVRSLPVNERTAAERAVREIIPRFGFSPSEIDGIERIPQRIKNVNYRVRAGGVDWVLKRYVSPKASEQLAFAHTLQLKLAEHAFPLAPLRPTPTGGTLVTDETGSYSLHEWVPGRQISIDERDAAFSAHPDMVRELGAALGRFHLLTSSMILPDVGPPADPDFLLRAPCQSFTSLRRRSRTQMLREMRLRLRPRKSEFDHWILEHLPLLNGHAARLAETSVQDRIDSSDIVASHHDINWENLIFTGDFRLQALLDFDNATRTHRDLDVGLAAAVLVGPDADRLTTFLSAYTDAAEHPVDRSVVEIGVQLKCIRSVAWSIDAYLSGRVTNEEMLLTWSRHLFGCLADLTNDRRHGLLWVGMIAPTLAEAEAFSVALAI